MLTVISVIVAVVCASWALYMLLRTRWVETETTMTVAVLSVDHQRHEDLWSMYSEYLGGVTDRFMSWCDAVAEAEGDLQAAAKIHQTRYPDSLGSGMPQLPISSEDRDRIVRLIVADLNEIANEQDG